MGYSTWFCIETKTFEFVFEVRISVLRVYERSGGWLLATLEALKQAEGLKEFMMSSRVGNKAFIVQRCSKKCGHDLQLPEVCFISAPIWFEQRIPLCCVPFAFQSNSNRVVCLVCGSNDKIKGSNCKKFFRTSEAFHV